MCEPVEKRFLWVLKKFSTLKDECYLSRPFVFSGWNWRIIAFPNNKGHLSLYIGLLNPESLSSIWTRKVKFRLTVVNKISKDDTKVLDGQKLFTARNHRWGFSKFLRCHKLRDDGFLVGDKLIIVADVHALPTFSTPEEFEKFLESLRLMRVSFNRSKRDSSCQVVQKTENTGESLKVGNLGMRCNNVASKTEVSNVDNDDAPQGASHDDAFEDGQGDDDDASSLLSSVNDKDVSSINKLKSMEDASKTVENGDTGCTNVASATEASNDLLKEIQPVKETMDVNGFHVFPSHVESVSHIFKRHPDIALGFRPKNQQIRKAYMNELLSVIDMLCQPPEKLSEDDLRNADETLVDLIDAGFKLDWLKTKLDDISEKKKIEQGSGARLQTMEEELQKLKQMFLDLETQLQMEKAEASAARAPLSFNDVVC
ncbi:hypothetical protein ARALYDRAFT_907320 [Arabidopsis lyrata subsp. lyrata]|uniref:MATH domain-containing protein n=1 Tax=Arabidopsis lyrata subsp. lyrata TaxID=81972 RepID=D7LW37_ARALL|nr:hypothetical protein ARALYDRAFT_907320 [Arabidopsis lyrata subsp. lyrata]